METQENPENVGMLMIEAMGQWLSRGESDASRARIWVDFITKVAKLDINTPASNGKTLLRMAVESPNPNLGIVNTILAAGAFVDGGIMNVALQKRDETKKELNEAWSAVKQGYDTVANRKCLREAERVTGIRCRILEILDRARNDVRSKERAVAGAGAQGAVVGSGKIGGQNMQQTAKL